MNTTHLLPENAANLVVNSANMTSRARHIANNNIPVSQWFSPSGEQPEQFILAHKL